MKILVLDAYFEPENTAFTHLEKDLLEAFVAAGHEVEVVCPTPTRAVSEELIEKYRNIRLEKLYGGNVTVHRVFVPRERRGIILRALRYFLCNHRLYKTAKSIKDADVIFSNSTPPIQALVAAKLKKKLKIPFVYDLQDIFPDSLVGIGKTKKGSLIYRVGRRIENRSYAAADKIIVISEDFKSNIMGKGVPENKIEVVYNWVDCDAVKPILRGDNPLFDELSLDEKDFTVVYAGNFGRAQGVKTVFDAAMILKERKDIKFVLFGGGEEYEELKNYKEQNGLDNLVLNPLLDQKRVSEVYSLGSVDLVTCKKSFGRAAFPSKTWNIMACNLPIIASYDEDSELAKVLQDSGAGIMVEPEDPAALAKAIIAFKDSPFNVSARQYVLRNADKTICVKKYVDVIEKAADNSI